MDKILQGTIGELVSSLVESYGQHSIISNIDSDKRLDREMIIKICDAIRQVLFPGYFEYKRLKNHTVQYHVGELLENISYELTKQVEKALDFVDGSPQRTDGDICAGADGDICAEADGNCRAGAEGNCRAAADGNCRAAADGKNRAKAEEIVNCFLHRLLPLRDILAKDVQAAYDGDPAAFNTDEVIFSYPGLHAITVYRIAHELHILGTPMIPRIMTEYAHSLTGIDIHPGAQIGEFFFIDHGTGVVIGETTVIGKNVKIYQGVTLGGLSTRGGQSLKNVKRHPTLGDNVTVYAGASILGGETVIGEGAVIGSNAFITSSVPDHTRVSIKNPELQFKVRGSVRTQELGQEGFFNRKEND